MVAGKRNISAERVNNKLCGWKLDQFGEQVLTSVGGTGLVESVEDKDEKNVGIKL